MVNNQEIRATLDRHWEFTGIDIDRSHEIYHNDVIVEFPQSGERISGKHNIYELRAHYPAKVTFKILRIRGEGNLWITELIITYDGRPVNVVTIMEFRNGKVAHETHYYGDPFEPPEWRSQWVEIIKEPLK
jgi:hypothetical protein